VLQAELAVVAQQFEEVVVAVQQQVQE